MWDVGDVLVAVFGQRGPTVCGFDPMHQESPTISRKLTENAKVVSAHLPCRCCSRQADCIFSTTTGCAARLSSWLTFCRIATHPWVAIIAHCGAVPGFHFFLCVEELSKLSAAGHECRFPCCIFVVM